MVMNGSQSRFQRTRPIPCPSRIRYYSPRARASSQPRLGRSYSRTLAAGALGFFWFTLEDGAFDPTVGYGLVGQGPDYPPKPAYTAYQAATNFLAGATFCSAIAQGNAVSGYVEGYRFVKPNGSRVSVLWSAALPSDTAIVALPVQRDVVTRYNTYGTNPTTIHASGNSVTVSVDGNPIYLVEEPPPAGRPMCFKIMAPLAPT